MASYTRHMDESDDESENSEDRRFIASESEEEEEAEYTEEEDEVNIKKKIEMEAKDDTVDALIESMDEQTLLLYQQSLAEDACQSEQEQRPRRSKRRRTRPKTWYELHPEDCKVLLEDTNPQDLCQQEESPEPEEDDEDSYQPSDSD